MKKVLVLSTLLFLVVGGMFASYKWTPSRELNLANTLLADNYAFTLFPSLMPAEDSKVWFTITNANFVNVAAFCKKSPIFNVYLNVDNQTNHVNVMQDLYGELDNGVFGLNFVNSAENYQSPLNIGYAIDLGALKAGILVDYQVYKDYFKQNTNAAAATNTLDVSHNLFNLLPGVSLNLGDTLKIDVSAPIVLSFLKHEDTTASAVTTNASVTGNASVLNQLGIMARGQYKLNDVFTLGVSGSFKYLNMNYSVTTNLNDNQYVFTKSGAGTNSLMVAFSWSCVPSELISIYGDVYFAQVTGKGGKDTSILTNVQSATTNYYNTSITTTKLPSINLGVEMHLGKFSPRIGVQNTYTTTLVKTPTLGENFTQPLGSTMVYGGFGLELGNFTFDAILATGAGSLVNALGTNPLDIVATAIGFPTAPVTATFGQLEVTYRF